MSHWNYRVVKKRHHLDAKEIIYEIHEVYYDHENKIEFWSQNPMKPFGQTPDEVAKDVDYMRDACRKPVLNEEELPGYAKTERTTLPDVSPQS